MMPAHSTVMPSTAFRT